MAQRTKNNIVRAGTGVSEKKDTVLEENRNEMDRLIHELKQAEAAKHGALRRVITLPDGREVTVKAAIDERLVAA